MPALAFLMLMPSYDNNMCRKLHGKLGNNLNFLLSLSEKVWGLEHRNDEKCRGCLPAAVVSCRKVSDVCIFSK
jgi:hypothetical protein